MTEGWECSAFQNVLEGWSEERRHLLPYLENTEGTRAFRSGDITWRVVNISGGKTNLRGACEGLVD